jgi:hypothetical protein
MLNSVAKPTSIQKKQSRPEQNIPAIIELPCGCRLGYSMVMTKCEEARELYRAMLALGPDVPTDDDTPEVRAYQEHITEQLERLETSQGEDE